MTTCVAPHPVVFTLMLAMTAKGIAAERTALNATEIKNLQYLSRSLLKGRALEKERMDREVEVQCQHLKAMQSALHGADGVLLSTISKGKREQLNISSVGDLVVDGLVVSSGDDAAISPGRHPNSCCRRKS